MIYRTRRSFVSYVWKPAAFLLLLAGLFLTVRLRADLTNLEYQIAALEKERGEILKERKSLVAKKAEAFSMREVERVAMERLGLGSPDRTKVFYVKRDGRSAPLQTAFKAGR